MLRKFLGFNVEGKRHHLLVNDSYVDEYEMTRLLFTVALHLNPE
jgi:hypothetical protein